MSTFSDALSDYVKKSKKAKRLESKKKKALAFLSLLESKKNAEGEQGSEGPPRKKICLDNDADGSPSRRSSSGDSESSTPHVSKWKGILTDDAEYARAKQVLRAQQKWTEYDAKHGKNEQQSKKSLKNGPNISLSLRNLLPFSKIDDDMAEENLMSRLPPLFVMDLQHLLLLALLKECSFWMPRWCRLVRPRKLSSVVLVVLKDISITDFEDNPDKFPFLRSQSQNCVEMVSPTQYSSTVDQDLCIVPLSISQMKRYTKGKDVRKEIMKLISIPIEDSQDKKEEDSDDHSTTPFSGLAETTTGGNPVQCTDEHEEEEKEDNELEEGEIEEEEEDEQFPRTSLLLSTLQMMEEGYPMPVDTKNKRYADFVFSKDTYIQPKLTSPMFSLDCEMCQTCTDAYELTRVSIVDEKRQVVYDQLVKPHNKITNYLTRYSGMTEELLEPVTKRLTDVQKDIRNLLPPDAILCGQSLWNDLGALKMFHPYVIDTSVIFNQSGDKKIKCGLRKLAQNFLGRTIQDSEKGHCSIEDAKATMDLVKLKLQKGIEFGDAKLGGVYFPDIQTYFNKPSQAQNVEETFSSRPTLADLESFPRPQHSQSQSEDCERKSISCVQSAYEDNSKCKPVNDRHDKITTETKRVSEEEKERQQTEGRREKEEDSEGQEKMTAKTEDKDGAEQQTERGKEGEEDSEGQERKISKTEDQDVVEQRKEWEGMNQEVFFQQKGSSLGFSFFEVVADGQSTVGVVGRKDLVEKFPSQQCVAAEDDNDIFTKALDIIHDKDFTWLELRAFADLLLDEQICKDDDVSGREKRKNIFSQLDEQVRQFVWKLQERTLVAVLLTGRLSEGQHLNAATFVTIS